MKRLLRFLLPVAVLACLALLVITPVAWAELTVKANHDHVDIHLNYHGSTVTVRGNSDPGTDLILTISTDGSQEKLMKKDKIAGFIWMNKDKLTFENVPELYMLRSTEDVNKLLGSEQLEASGIGYVAIDAAADIDPSSDSTNQKYLLEEFIRYKEAKNLYATSAGEIDVSSESGSQTYFTAFDWPYQAPTGDYKVTAYEVKDGQVIDSAEAGVTVTEAGVVKVLDDMAKNNGALYGLAAVAVALASGFVVGMIFKGGGAH